MPAAACCCTARCRSVVLLKKQPKDGARGGGPRPSCGYKLRESIGATGESTKTSALNGGHGGDATEFLWQPPRRGAPGRGPGRLGCQLPPRAHYSATSK